MPYHVLTFLMLLSVDATLVEGRLSTIWQSGVASRATSGIKSKSTPYSYRCLQSVPIRRVYIASSGIPVFGLGFPWGFHPLRLSLCLTPSLESRTIRDSATVSVNTHNDKATYRYRIDMRMSL